jgi:ATP-dependent DNA ligase
MDEDDRERIRAEVKMFMFDMIDLNRLETRPPVGRQRKPRIVEPTPQIERSANLRSLLMGSNSSAALQVLPSRLCSSVEEVDAAYALFSQTYEGAIVKHPTAPYYFIRSDAWLKMKPSTTEELTITGVIAGEGKHVGRLGALVGTLPSGAVVRVGTGQSDAERVRLWAMREQLPGMLAEVSYQSGTVAKARHPVFHRLREIG